MKVFISWSGHQSRGVATALREWFPTLFETVDFWMSEEDIKPGSRWFMSIANELECCDFGIVCVTRENAKAEWLMFEAGALAKRVEQAKLVALCVDLPPADVTGPLGMFQGLPLTRGGMLRLTESINSSCDRPRNSKHLTQLFDNMWGDLRRELDKARAKPAPTPEVKRSAEEMLGEIVLRVREIESRLEGGALSVREEAIVGEQDRNTSSSRGVESGALREGVNRAFKKASGASRTTRYGLG
ncbi:toll/interleukin-1 receptor domain-containing protein [Streptomyces sp. NPDC001633]|uniref:toll/interleukin-1 receptor domain-containing protein n=1 Tax=Streptomyces sp. NPDC001633 TaxID=3364595 RepID=UPI0036A1AF0D